MSLSQQTAASVLRQDRADIKLSEIIAGSKVYLYVRGRIYKVENEKGAVGQ